MPTQIAGRQLGVALNGIFTAANTDRIPGGRLWPEAALTWNAMRVEALKAGVPAEEFMPAGSRSSARTLSAQRVFYASQPPAAAYPGSSNHGWGIAVDVAGRRAAAWIMRNGHRYGWSHDEGARVGEWWHFRYVGASRATLRRLTDRFAGFTAAERRWITEYDKLLKADRDLARRRELRVVMTAQRKRLWRAARPRAKGGDGRGWGHGNRRARYDALVKRST